MTPTYYGQQQLPEEYSSPTIGNNRASLGKYKDVLSVVEIEGITIKIQLYRMDRCLMLKVGDE